MPLTPGSFGGGGATIETAGGVYFNAASNADIVGGAAFVTGRIFYVPIYLKGGRTYSELHLLSNADPAKARYAIYADNNGEPGALIADAGETAAALSSGTGNPRTLNAALNAGWYWLAVQFSATTGANVFKTVRAANCGSVTGSNLVPTGLYQDRAYAAFPATATITGRLAEGGIASMPAIGIRV